MGMKSALSPPLSVQLTVSFTAPLTSPERSTQERVGMDGGTEENVTLTLHICWAYFFVKCYLNCSCTVVLAYH